MSNFFDLNTVKLVAYRPPSNGEFYLDDECYIRKAHSYNCSTLIVEPLPGTLFCSQFNLNVHYFVVKQIPKKYTVIKIEGHFKPGEWHEGWSYLTYLAEKVSNNEATITQIEE